MSSGKKSIDGLAPASKKRSSSNVVQFKGGKKSRRTTAKKVRHIGIEEAHSDFWDDEITGLGLTRPSHEAVELGSEESFKELDEDFDDPKSKKAATKAKKQSEKAKKKAKKRKAK